MVEVKDICRSFKESDGSELEILKNISFTIQKGDKVALMGASGSGKTTLLQIIGGLDRQTSGEIWIDGNECGRLSSKELAKFRNETLGYIFQFHHLLSDFKAIENVAMPGIIGGMSRKEASERAKKYLEMVGLSERLEHHPAELSGGERQRVALARALFNSPSLLLADEPTGNLDSENSQHFLDIISDLNKNEGQTVLIATHDNRVADAMDYCLIIEDGVVVRR